jgi:KDO2-lipid IV(A) lauroyltransferase
VVTGHLGNWELAGAVLAGLGFGVSAVVKRQGNRRVHRRLERLRRGLGVEPVPMAVAGRRIPGALSEGRVVALVADQDAGRKGVFVPFLGRPASTFRGPARLALEHRVPLVFGALVREAGRYRALARHVWSPDEGETASGAGRGPADPGVPGPGRPGEDELTGAWVAELERAVRERPGQYFWFHRRWKTRPRPDRDRS